MSTTVLTSRWSLFAFATLLALSCTRRRGTGNKTGVGTEAPVGEPRCGNRIVEDEEVCDGDPYCLADCSGFDGECGDGVIQASREECDTGDESSAGCDECDIAFSCLCSGEPSECEQTGLPSELVLATAGDDVIATYTWGSRRTGTRNRRCAAVWAPHQRPDHRA